MAAPSGARRPPQTAGHILKHQPRAELEDGGALAGDDAGGPPLGAGPEIGAIADRIHRPAHGEQPCDPSREAVVGVAPRASAISADARVWQTAGSERPKVGAVHEH